jgi:O-succinylbenzoic acid--CoA ligase
MKIKFIEISNQLKDSIQSFVAELMKDDFYVVVPSSGSTGIPKNIEISKKQIEESVKLSQKALNFNAGDTALLCLNPSFIAGKMMIARSFFNKMDLVCVNPSNDPLNGLNEKVDFAAFVPLQMYSMLRGEFASERITQLNHMKCIILGGENVNYSLRMMLQEIETPVYHTYGMTETVSHIALRRLNGEEKSESYKILDGVKIKQNTNGCLEICSPTTNFNWIVTNDVVELIDHERFIWKGRSDNIINSGGVKIQPELVEKQIEQFFTHQNIPYKFFVTGINDEKYGQKLVLVLEKESKISPQSESKILEEISHLVPAYHAPKQVFSLSKFALSSSGKIDRKSTISTLLQEA